MTIELVHNKSVRIPSLILGALDTEEQKERFKKNPDEYLQYCKDIESEISQNFTMFLRGTPESDAAKKVRRPASSRSAGYNHILTFHL